MATEYKLKYTGQEIDNKLDQVGTNMESISRLSEEIVDNLFNTKAKSILIEILRNTAFTENQSENIKKLAVAIGVQEPEEPENEYRIYVIEGSASGVSDGDVLCTNYTIRRMIVASDGVRPYYSEAGLVPQAFYPIQIPIGAKNVLITSPSECEYYGVQIFLYDGEKYSMRVVDTGWKSRGTGSNIYEIPTEYANGSYYLAVNFKRNGDAAFTNDFNSSEIAIEFISEDVQEPEEPESPEFDYSGFGVTGSVYLDTNGNCLYSIANNRRTIVASEGVHRLRDETTWSMSEYYLNQIPVGTKTAVVVAPTECAYYGVQIFGFNSENKPIRVVDSGWMEHSGQPKNYNIPSDYADGNYSISVNFKNTSGTEFSDDFNNAELGIAFVYV